MTRFKIRSTKDKEPINNKRIFTKKLIRSIHVYGIIGKTVGIFERTKKEKKKKSNK